MDTNFKDRLQELIDYLISKKEVKSLNDFDKKIGVARNNTYNIIDGRCKEPSLPFVKKVLTTFTYISTDWLVLGEGDMFKSEQNTNVESILENQKILESENNNLKMQLNGLLNMVSVASMSNQHVNFQPVSNRTPARKRVIVSQLPLFANSVANSTWLSAL